MKARLSFYLEILQLATLGHAVKGEERLVAYTLKLNGSKITNLTLTIGGDFTTYRYCFYFKAEITIIRDNWNLCNDNDLKNQRWIYENICAY